MLVEALPADAPVLCDVPATLWDRAARELRLPTAW